MTDDLTIGEGITVIEDPLDVIAHILYQFHAPVHWDILFNGLVARGIAQIDGTPETQKKEEQRIYNYIYQDIRKNGEMSRFRKCGRAMFIIADHFNPTLDKLSTPNKTKNNPEQEIVMLPAVRKVCGTCRHIEYNGIQEASLTDGVCGEYAVSGRVGVHDQERACDLWQRKTKDQVMKQRERQLVLRVFISQLNREAHKFAGGMRLPVGKVAKKPMTPAEKAAAQAPKFVTVTLPPAPKVG